MGARLNFKIGEKNNRLTIIKETDPYIRKDGHGVFRKVLVKCSCGNIFPTTLSDFKKGRTKSCGCLRKELAHNRGKHWMTHSRFYMIYHSIKDRCDKKNCQDYKDYGGRGIKNKWKTFIDFKNDMYESYILHLTKYGKSNTRIDRINNNKGYYKENCRWATHIQQARNRRSNHLITYMGKTQTMTEWAIEYKIKVGTLSSRLNSYNWSIKKALTTPSRGNWRSNK